MVDGGLVVGAILLLFGAIDWVLDGSAAVYIFSVSAAAVLIIVSTVFLLSETKAAKAARHAAKAEKNAAKAARAASKRGQA